ncbi:MAG: toxin-antitoxin system YwqK family antitoxin [Bacteroidales bacterium]|nr:toxin-antitoxin system YwqK family antitoxin [Bacteroidales bacterium]
MKFLVKILFVLIPFCGYSQIEIILGSDTSYYKSISDFESFNVMKEGYWKIYFSESKIKEEGLYTENLKEGRWISYYLNGNVKQIVTYEKGLAHGNVKMYYDNGLVSEEGFWNGKEKCWVGEYKFYFENGNPNYLWYYSENGKRTGVQRYFHENGKLSIEGEWKDGAEVGVIKKYYDNGTIKSEEVFFAGKMDVSSVKIYDKQVAATDTIDRFSGNGYYKSKNTKGQIVFEGVWKDGKFADGDKFIYDGNGKLIKIQIYRNGNLMGEKDPF